MKKRLQDFRDNLICEAWEKNKAVISMKDLSEIFEISLPQIYRVLKRSDSEKNLKTNSKEKEK